MGAPEVLTAYDAVKAHYTLPFELYPFQQNAVNELAPLSRSALYFEPGLGKTATSTVCALLHMIQGADSTIVLMPPIIISTWRRWLSKVKRMDGTPLKVLAYQGAPAERKRMHLNGHEFVLMSMQIFKRDYERICAELGGFKLHVTLDEGQCIKDVGTQNYKLYRDFVETQSHQILTGTPLNTPLDAYAYIKLKTPTVYMNLAQFTRIHVLETDFFDNPTKFQNLDLLSENLLIYADRKTKEEVLPDLPACTIALVEYALAPAHLKLYRKLVDEQLLKLPDNSKLDFTESSALYHAMNQVPMQWHYFGQDDGLKSSGYDLIDQILEELGDKKLVIFANYRRTNAEIQRRYGCPGVWGEVTAKDKQRALDKFIDDDKCRLVTMAPTAGGVGVDGLQHVCADVLYVEPPVSVSQLTQSLSRVHRDGQKLPVTVRLALAEGTVQKHMATRLAERENLVNPVQMSKAVLRDILLGGG